MSIVLVATLTNLDFSPDLHDAAGRLVRAFTLSLSWRDAVDGLRNVVLFAGLGAVWMLATPATRGAMRRATLVGLVLSGGIEAVQTFSPVRTASIIDVTTDTLGAWLGALVVLLALDLATQERATGSRFGIPASLACAPYLLAALSEALTPLFYSAPLRVSGGPIARLDLTLSLSKHLSWAAVPWSDLPLFIPAGFLALVLLVAFGWRRRGAWIAVSASGAIALVVVHVGHGAAGLLIHWEAVLTDAVGVGVGAWLAHRWLRWRRPGTHRVNAREAMRAYAVLLALWAWRPFRLETNPQDITAEFLTERLIPLRALAERVDLFSVAHTAQQFLLYVPLGALMAVAASAARTRLRWRDSWPATLLVPGVELGHLLIADRTFDATNAMLAWAGLAIGWIVMRRTDLESRDELPPRSRWRRWRRADADPAWVMRERARRAMGR